MDDEDLEIVELPAYTEVINLDSSDDENSPDIDTEPTENGEKRKSTASDDENSPDINIEPTENGDKRKSTASDDENSPHIDIEPTENGNKRKSTARDDENSPDINIEPAENGNKRKSTARDDENSPDINIEPTENGDKRKSTARDDENSPDINIEPTENGNKRKSTDSSKSESKETSNNVLERQTKKQKLAEEKIAKEATAQLNKMYKKGECMKYMNIEGHPSLWERWYMSDVPREAAQQGAHVTQAHTLCNPALIVWTRTVPRTLDTEGGQVKLSPVREPCDRALYVADVEELCEMVRAHTLSSHLAQIRQLCDCRLTLLVFRSNDYFKSKGRTNPSVHSAPRRSTSNSNRHALTEIDFELAITDLIVTADVDTVVVNTASELALTIVQFTKAIAEAPIKKSKRACDEKAAFYMRGDNKNCIAVDKDGVGVARLWQQMLAVLPHSSLETSRAICAQYKSPLALYESLQSEDSVSKLADIGVSRAGPACARARRVGPEFARKLHALFMASDGNQLIE